MLCRILDIVNRFFSFFYAILFVLSFLRFNAIDFFPFIFTRGFTLHTLRDLIKGLHFFVTFTQSLFFSFLFLYHSLNYVVDVFVCK